MSLPRSSSKDPAAAPLIYIFPFLEHVLWGYLGEASCHAWRMLGSPVERPTWQGGETCHQPREWAWKRILQPAGEAASVANSLSPASWGILSQDHSAQPLLDP